MRTTRVQWLVLASALLGYQALMQGCSSCGDKDKTKVDGGDGGGMGDEDGGDGDGGRDGGDGGGQAGTPGIDVVVAQNLTTTEAGGQAMFTIVLSSKPSSNVVIPLSSSDTDEGIVGQDAVTFTPDNWAAPQTVTVTGVDDAERDGNAQYEIEIGAAESDDDDYDGMDADDISVTNLDNDSAGVKVTAAANLQTTEEGGTATFTVVLLSQPSANVTIALASSDTTEGTVAPAQLVFTTSNWESPQTGTITGVADDELDGPKAYKIITTATSGDASYNGIEVADVDVTNVDLDTPGFIIEPLTNLSTSEDLGEASFSVRLTTQPSDSVTLGLESSDVSEVTIDKPSLTFTRDNWAGLQTVTVKGVNDDIADGDQPFTIRTAQAVSTDSRYALVDPSDVTGKNVDNDSAGLITVIPGGATTLTTTEDGSPQATFTIRLKSQPTQIVNVVISTDQAGEVSIAPTTVSFSSADWNSLKTVTLTGVNDDAKDGNKPFQIVIETNSTDDAYNGLDIPNLTGTNLDNDSAGVRVTAAANLRTRETAPGNQATFTVRLNSRPTSSVVVNLESSNTQEVTVSPISVTFTTANWSSPQTVTLTGVDDNVIDGDKTVQIVTSAAISSDADYNGLVVDDVTVVNADDDSPGLRLSKVAVVTSENLTQDTFAVSLNTQPSADVTVNVVSSRVGEATVSPATLTFTSANWNAQQTVTVTGVNDDMQDGIQTFAVNIGPGVSTDTNYNGLAAVSVDGTNADNDTAGLQTNNITNLVTGENVSAPQATFEVVLTAQPSADVDVPVVSLNTAEGTAGPATLHFTTSNWNSPQTVTVTGQEDSVEDGAQDYFIQVGPATSTDANYAGKTVPNVKVSNTDNDTAGITVAPLTALEVTEGGEQDTFTVVLNSQPTADVTISIASSDTGEATVAPATLTFTPVNWSAPQQVVVTGRADLLQDGHQAFQVLIGPAASSDAKYNGRTVPNLDGTNLDLDSPAIRVIVAHDLHTDETNGQDSFQVVLLNQPAADVIIPIVSSDVSEGTVGPASLTFTTVNWASPQVVTITGADDDVDDGNQPYFILVGPAMSTDPNYGGRVVPNVPVSNTDDDTAGVTVVATEPLTTTELAGADTFTIVLNSEPTAPVTFTLTSSDTGEATVAPASITFNAGNWSSPQTVTVTGVNDAIDDGAQPFLVNIGAPSSTDPNYAAQFVPSVTGSNTDDDTAGVTVTAGVLTTTEAGGTASFTVVLNSEPVADVLIPVVSDTPTEGLVTVPGNGSLIFNSANWNIAQTVTLTGQNDFVQDGPRPYQIVLGTIQSADGTYSPIVIPNLSATNTDNDTAGITVSPLGPISTTEAGVTTTFTVVLNSQPTDAVTIALASDDATEATVSPAGFTFTPGDWNVPQTVTVTGQDDFVADNNQPFAILIGPAASTDPNYNGRTVPNVNGTNQDNDSPGYVLSTTTVSTYEFEVSTTFTVRLTSQPTADLTIAVSSSVPGEASVAPSSLTFNAGNWNVDQTVTVTGVDDASLDGDQQYVIVLGAAVSADPVYNGLNPNDVNGWNYEAALSCKEWHTRHPGFPSGQFRLDTDRTGPNPRFIGYCDMVSDGGGFTLLSWTGDSGMGTFGVPYPGRAYCPALNCARGSAVPSGSIDALFDNSGDLAQGQSTTIGNLIANYQELEDYEFAGVYAYGSLANLSLEAAGFTGCGGVATGTYEDIIGTAVNNGRTVYVNSGLHSDGNPALGDFSSESNLYQWSVGSRGGATGYCTLDPTSPSSYLGTFDDGQYGPAVVSAAGSYSVWVR